MNEKTSTVSNAGWGLLGMVLLFAIMIGLAFAWVAIYAYVITPGRADAFYEAYAQRASPVVSVVVGGPVFYFVTRWLTRRRLDARAAWIAVILYLIADFGIIAGTGNFTEAIVYFFIGATTLKLAGAMLGVRRARDR